MGEHRLAGGGILTDEDIERMCERCERGNYDSGELREPPSATASFVADGGCIIEGEVCALHEDGIHLDVRDAAGVVHEGIEAKSLTIIKSVWEKIAEASSATGASR